MSLDVIDRGAHEALDKLDRSKAIARVERAMADFREGKLVILTDDEDRENEGDFILAAEKATPEAINFMATHGRGLICLTLTQAAARALDLPLMVRDNESPFQTAFTVSIEAARGVTTGISAADRATTIRAAVAPGATPKDLVRPGHIFPLIAREGGVLVRTGQTEGSVDLARLAGLDPSGVLCEIMKADGTMARRPDLEVFAEQHGLTLLTVADIIAYRLERERLVERVEVKALADLAGIGAFTALRYRSHIDGREHLALVRGELDALSRDGAQPPLVRIQTTCLLGDTFGSTDCDCGSQLRRGLARLSSEPRGVFIYLRQGNDSNLDLCCPREKRQTAIRESEIRELGIGAQLLRDLGVTELRLLSDTAGKAVGLEGYGLRVTERVAF
ncbi:MAG: 3,4-dihydroxy-2-butanone-4-phosphate synthase [Myxococcales bacterium]|jgi:3,4-dihydroxy 2-butanone 4-phosphate synthase/GTP cyclohydrolase II|nr:3,4-dihydroxy-2-butanone-4-phosphate synthase [Myxococcales bacterium]